MKRTTLFAGMLAMLMSVTCLCESTTEADVEKEILFRGLPWGSTYTETMLALPEGARSPDVYPNSRIYSFDELMYDQSFSKEKIPCEISSNALVYLKGKQDPPKVAGYDITDINLQFVYHISDDGLNTDISSGHLFYAEYEITPNDIDVVYDDLVRKLSTLYGEPDEVTTFGYDKAPNTLWYGANDTVVALVKDTGSVLGPVIDIKYCFRGADDLQEEARQALVKAEQEKVASDVDGL